MKNIWTTVVGLLVVVLLALFYFTRERHFVWDANTKFLPKDDEPFGSKLFDQMAEATFPNGYRVYDGDFEKLLNSDERCSLLLLYTELNDVSDYYEALQQFVEKGNKVMFVCGSQSAYSAEGTSFEASIYSNYMHFSTESLKEVLTGEIQPDKVMMMKDGEETIDISELFLNELESIPMGAKITSVWYTMTSEMLESTMDKPSLDNTDVKINSDAEENVEAVADVDFEELAAVDEVVEETVYNKKIYNALSYEMKAGKGTAYVVAAPLLFTNYGVLDKKISRYLGYQMGQLADLPVVRVSYRSLTQYNMAHGARNYGGNSRISSPLSHLLQYEPLRWALYTMLCAALIFMFFTARHRQRVIPVVAKPVNRNMEFVKLLGTIYYRRHDNHDLFLKKYTYFKEELRRKQMIDLEDERKREGNARMLAMRTNMEEEEMAKTLELFRAVAEADDLDNKQLQECIQKIDDILAKLS